MGNKTDKQQPRIFSNSNHASNPKRAFNNSLKLDALDIKIIRELVVNPEISSLKMGKKFGIPLSTVRRRKAKLDASVITKKYVIDTQELGWRKAEILMVVENGKADYVAQVLIQKFDNITTASMRINSGNLAVSVTYKNSDELHELLEKIRRVPDITSMQWTEIVREIGDENQRLANLVFSASQEK
jgi:DNA-binding Lrp family transcriptional regulator